MEKTLKSLNSSDPFKVADDLGIHVLQHELGEIYGYYCKMGDEKFIILNKYLDQNDTLFTCAHELGHALLHPEELTPMLTRLTMTSNLKIEREANQFAMKFLIDGRHKEYDITNKYQILDFYGLPYEMERFI